MKTGHTPAGPVPGQGRLLNHATWQLATHSPELHRRPRCTAFPQRRQPDPPGGL